MDSLQPADDLLTYQPPPAQTDGDDSDCWLLVLEDCRKRREVGIAKYGMPLRVNDGRHALVDAYQEQMDNLVYTRKAIEQFDELLADNRRLTAENDALRMRITVLETLNAGFARRIHAQSEILSRKAEHGDHQDPTVEPGTGVDVAGESCEGV